MASVIMDGAEFDDAVDFTEYKWARPYRGDKTKPITLIYAFQKMVAELATAATLFGATLAPSTGGNVPISNGAGAWVRSRDTATPAWFTALTIGGTTDSSSSTTGIVTVAGGVGIAKKLYIGTGLTVVSGTSAFQAITGTTLNLSSTLTVSDTFSVTKAGTNGYLATIANTGGGADDNGLLVRGASSSGEYALHVVNEANTFSLFAVKGTGIASFNANGASGVNAGIGSVYVADVTNVNVFGVFGQLNTTFTGTLIGARARRSASASFNLFEGIVGTGSDGTGGSPVFTVGGSGIVTAVGFTAATSVGDLNLSAVGGSGNIRFLTATGTALKFTVRDDGTTEAFGSFTAKTGAFSSTGTGALFTTTTTSTGVVYTYLQNNSGGSGGLIYLYLDSAAGGNAYATSPAYSASVQVAAGRAFALTNDTTLRFFISGANGDLTNISAGNYFIPNTSAPTGAPTGGGFFWVEAGALKYRGSSGTVTPIAAA